MTPQRSGLLPAPLEKILTSLLGRKLSMPASLATYWMTVRPLPSRAEIAKIQGGVGLQACRLSFSRSFAQMEACSCLTMSLPTVFPKKDACFSKIKNIADLLSDDKKVK